MAKKKNSQKIKQWIWAAGIRALKTFCQTLLAYVTLGSTIFSLAWSEALGVSLTACLFSLLTSVITKLPEIDFGTEKLEKNENAS